MTHSAQQLTEHIHDWRTRELVVDSERRLLLNVALAGLHSKNGYRYTEDALRHALPLYDGKPVFLDHAANARRPFERSTRDLAGSIRAPRFVDGRIRGDIQLLDTEAGRTLLALADAEQPSVGMSHVVLARRNADHTIVEAIEDVVSVDAVVFPATSATFRESLSHDASLLPGSYESILSQIDAELPGRLSRLAAAEPAANSARRAGLFPHALLLEFPSPDDALPRYAAITWSLRDNALQLGEQLHPVDIHRPLPEQLPPPEPTPLQNRLAELSAENERLQRLVDQLQAQQAADHLLRESNLPPQALTPAFREQLIQAPDDHQRRALIEDRRQLVERLARPAPTSQPRRQILTTLSDEALVTLLKRRPQSPHNH